ncbi:MAG: DnaJ domain-containing protein [Pseudomonadota bacterium]|nr:DnaJ domain-containing protein [Pseudomonadota bacterium]
MTSAIGRLRLNHYEALGIGSDASRADIERAFFRKVSSFLPHTFGNVAEASTAYETLKDPDKRQVYDRSIGLGRAADPARPVPLWSGRPWSITAGPVVGARPLSALPAMDRPLLTPRAEPSDVPAARPDDRPFIGASAPPTDPKRLEPYAAPSPLSVSTLPDPPRSRFPAHSMMFDMVEEGQGMIRSTRTALIAVSLVVGVAVIGGWIGWAAGNDEQAPKSQLLNEKPPRAIPQTADTIAVPASNWQAQSGPTALPVSRVGQVKARPGRRAAPMPSPPPPADEAAQQVPAVTAPPPDAESGTDHATTPAEAPVAAPTPAALPLSSGAAARTIERIGYSCGTVSSTVASGAPGVFTVTCTSGQSYRATPVRGRYHFRRVAKP